MGIGVGVLVAIGVPAGEGVFVAVSVDVDVSVAAGVAVGGSVFVAVGVDVRVGVRVAVAVGVVAEAAVTMRTSSMYLSRPCKVTASVRRSAERLMASLNSLPTSEPRKAEVPAYSVEGLPRIESLVLRLLIDAITPMMSLSIVMEPDRVVIASVLPTGSMWSR